MRANDTTVAQGAVGQSTRWRDTDRLALLGLGGPLAFMAVALLLPAVSEYSLLSDTISELALGRYGAVQTLAFFVAALGSLALTVGLQRTLPRTRGARVGSGLLAIWTLCLALDGLFPIDPLIPGVEQTPTGLIHLGAALVAFVSLLLAIFVLSFAFRRSDRWQRFFPWSFALGIAALIAFFLPSEGGRAGLYQRIFVGIVILWLALVALRLRAIAGERAEVARER
ncbi:MAG: hypothetical protein AVDCRST_MAG18-3136 [uncultured Thermomicrobiales bacterium]|uniref:DUF998 domain-containing protein n=1 Tax=uncultured Thermomicrobiales bacterium TaxID=1645740 RepID=A0A6J4VLV3_9BACT|nr:MAG: hypothetical protein AVDCRST_MAG18-3136 [uncultured Thermomicrobiales bacterium]